MEDLRDRIRQRAQLGPPTERSHNRHIVPRLQNIYQSVFLDYGEICNGIHLQHEHKTYLGFEHKFLKQSLRT